MIALLFGRVIFASIPECGEAIATRSRGFPQLRFLTIHGFSSSLRMRGSVLVNAT